MTDHRSGLTIRPMRRNDVPSLAGIEADRHPVAAWRSAAFHDALDAPDRSVCLVVVPPRPGDVVAYGVVTLAAGTADLDNLTVRADHERQGIGAWLLRALLDAALRGGAREVLLEVRHDNEPAIALYAAEGFTEISRRTGYYARGVDAIIMRRSLHQVADDSAASVGIVDSAESQPTARREATGG